MLIWAPNLIWQASHGWPQLELSAAIAAGSSGSSQPWWLFLPFQLVLVSPGAGAGLGGGSGGASPLRRPSSLSLPGASPTWCWSWCSCSPAGSRTTSPVSIPALLAAGALPTLRWVRAGPGRRRPVLLGLAFLVSLPNLVLMLPLLPERLLGPVVAVNYDAGETVGWPRFAETVGAAYDSLPAADHPIVLTENYGEAGAVERYLPGVPVYSGHNAYWDWGPPPPSARAAVLVGLLAGRGGTLVRRAGRGRPDRQRGRPGERRAGRAGLDLSLALPTLERALAPAATSGLSQGRPARRCSHSLVEPGLRSRHLAGLRLREMIESATDADRSGRRPPQAQSCGGRRSDLGS